MAKAGIRGKYTALNAEIRKKMAEKIINISK